MLVGSSALSSLAAAPQRGIPAGTTPFPNERREHGGLTELVCREPLLLSGIFPLHPHLLVVCRLFGGNTYEYKWLYLSHLVTCLAAND